MMTFPHNSIDGNSISSKTYLEFTVHLLELDYFNPVVFCHDGYGFSRKKYALVIAGFLDLLSFLDSCGITLVTNMEEANDVENEIYSHIMDVENNTDIVLFELTEADFTNMNISSAVVPENCTEDDFSLVKLYLLLRTGTALNKRSFEVILKRELSDSDIQTIRRQLANVTCRRIEKRRDNSYEMR